MRSSVFNRRRSTPSTSKRQAANYGRRSLLESLETRQLLAAITSGQTLTGKINSPGQTATYTFNAAAGETFRVSVGDISTDASGAEYYSSFTVKNPSGTTVVNQSTNNADASVTADYTVPTTAAGTYTVTVKDYYASVSGGSYAIEMAKTPGGIAADSNGDGGAITSGQTKTGSIQRFGDFDAFTFSAVAGDTFRVSVGDTSPESAATSFYSTLKVIDAKGKVVVNEQTNNADSSVTGQYTVPATAPGTYTILVGDYYGSFKNGTYALEFVKAPGTVAADSDGNGGAITSGQTKTGAIQRFGDIDAYTFTAAAGDFFRVSVGDTTPDSSTSQFYATVRVIDSKGVIVVNEQTNNADSSVTGQFTVPATAVGTYTILVQDYYAGSRGGTYAIEFVKAPGSLASDSDGNGGAIASGQTKTGTIQRYGDIDAYTFTGASGDTFRVAVGDTTSASSESEFYATVRVIDSNGKVVVNQSTNNAESAVYGQFTVPPTAVGTYTILVQDYYAGSRGGTYGLEFVKSSGPLAADSNGNGGAITSGQTKSGSIQRRGDLDAFTFSASVGNTFNITLGDTTPASSTNEFYAAFRVFDQTGKQVLIRETNNANSSVAGSYKILSGGAGTFTIVVYDYYGTSSGGTYNLNLTGTLNPVGNTASIAGNVFKDADGDGVKDTGETGIGGVVLYNDADNDNVKDTGEATATTDSSGNYKFGSLAAGSYRIRQVLPSGYTQTLPTANGSIPLTLTSGQTVTGQNFGNKPVVTNTASISGIVFNDADSDGVRDTAELGLGLWTVYIDADKDGVFDTGEKSATTDADGNWGLTGLGAGTYVVRVVQRAKTATTTATSLSVTLTAGQASTGKLFGEKRIA